MSKNHRYRSQLAAIANCPGSTATANFGPSSYHVVHDPMVDSDFSPQAIRCPRNNLSEEKQCKAWGVSMFESREQLQAFVKVIENRIKQFRLLIGDHSARFDVTSSDGNRTSADEAGHFTFFEYEHFQWQASAKDITKLP